MKYKNIIGGTEEDAEKKFPWLKEADFRDAEIDISQRWLIWKNGFWEFGYWEGGVWKDGFWQDGTWQDGVWESGYWQDGYWEDGWWEGGIWKDGVWENGKMWSNLQQKYIRVSQKDGKFEEAQK